MWCGTVREKLKMNLRRVAGAGNGSVREHLVLGRGEAETAAVFSGLDEGSWFIYLGAQRFVKVCSPTLAAACPCGRGPPRARSTWAGGGGLCQVALAVRNPPAHAEEPGGLLSNRSR